MNIIKTSFKILLFNGKASAYIFLELKFKARAWKKKVAPIYMGTVTVPTESDYNAVLLVVDEDACIATKKKNVKDFEPNTDAFDDLILSMDVSTDGGRIAFQLVNNSTLDENPNENAKIAWDRMTAKYKPSTAPRSKI